MKKILFALALLPFFCFTSCIKDIDDLPQNPNKDLKYVRVSSSFDWSTSKTIDVDITGLPTSVPIYSTLTISLNDGSILYQGNHAMSANTVVNLIIPNTEESIKLRFGTLEYAVPVIENKASVSFIPEVED